MSPAELSPGGGVRPQHFSKGDRIQFYMYVSTRSPAPCREDGVWIGAESERRVSFGAHPEPDRKGRIWVRQNST